jgi:hypothetical protein
VAAAANDTLAGSLKSDGAQSATVQALGLYNPACCQNAYERLPVSSARTGRMAADDRLQS